MSHKEVTHSEEGTQKTHTMGAPGEMDSPHKGPEYREQPHDPTSKGHRGADGAPTGLAHENEVNQGPGFADQMLGELGLQGKPVVALVVGLGLFYVFWKLA